MEVSFLQCGLYTYFFLNLFISNITHSMNKTGILNMFNATADKNKDF